MPGRRRVRAAASPPPPPGRAAGRPRQQGAAGPNLQKKSGLAVARPERTRRPDLPPSRFPLLQSGPWLNSKPCHAGNKESPAQTNGRGGQDDTLGSAPNRTGVSRCQHLAFEAAIARFALGEGERNQSLQ